MLINRDLNESVSFHIKFKKNEALQILINFNYECEQSIEKRQSTYVTSKCPNFRHWKLQERTWYVFFQENW